MDNKTADVKAAVKQEPQPVVDQRGDGVPRGWQGSSNTVRERQGALLGKLHAASPKAINGIVDAGVRGRGRSRGTGRGTGAKTKSGRPVGVDATTKPVAVEEAPAENEPRLSTPLAARPQEAAEGKEAQTPDYSSSLRKSPRSKEV